MRWLFFLLWICGLVAGFTWGSVTQRASDEAEYLRRMMELRAIALEADNRCATIAADMTIAVADYCGYGLAYEVAYPEAAGGEQEQVHPRLRRGGASPLPARRRSSTSLLRASTR